MTMFEPILTILTIALISFAAWTDIRRGKVYNRLTAPAMLIGLALNLWHGGLSGLLASAEGIGLGLALLLLSAFLGRLLGGGDIKLLMAVGALQGPVVLIAALLWMALIGGVLALAISLRERFLLKRLKSLGTGLVLRATQGMPMEVGDTVQQARLPYAIPIALGTLAAIFLPTFHVA
jgi:prepilin peptidase CpaA